MFKIVETIEKGSKKLTIVPSGWEDHDELSWPKFCTDKLIKNSDSLPEDSWFRMRCKLKRNHLLSYSIAEEELERMLQKSDTEQEETFIEPRKRSRISSLMPKLNMPYDEDFNSLATNACSISSASSPMPQNPIQIIAQHITGGSEIQGPSDTFETTDDVIYLPQDFHNANLEGKLDKILENQNKIIDNQNQIINQLKNGGVTSKENQIIEELAKLEAMLDTIGSKISNSTKNNLEQQKEKEPSDICDIEQIDNVDDLEKLERKLVDREVVEDFMDKLSYVCGRKGNGNGINNCYILIDRLFTRRFMTLCSWAGGARDKKEKIPFKIFKNVINLFFKVVSMSDRDFSLKDCEDFFKNVIRNSTRRNQSMAIRNSAIKRRPKNLVYSVKRKEGIQNDNEKEINIDEEQVTVEDTKDKYERDNLEEENDADVEDEN